jgi:hypothetical protein
MVVCVYVAVDLAPYAHGENERVAASAALMCLETRRRTADQGNVDAR